MACEVRLLHLRSDFKLQAHDDSRPDGDAEEYQNSVDRSALPVEVTTPATRRDLGRGQGTRTVTTALINGI